MLQIVHIDTFQSFDICKYSIDSLVTLKFEIRII